MKQSPTKAAKLLHSMACRMIRFLIEKRMHRYSNLSVPISPFVRVTLNPNIVKVWSMMLKSLFGSGQCFRGRHTLIESPSLPS